VEAAHSERSVGLPWSALEAQAIQAMRAARAVQPVPWDQRPAAAAQPEVRQAAAPLEPPEPPTEAAQPAPEP